MTVTLQSPTKRISANQLNSVVAALNNKFANYLPLVGGTMTGAINAMNIVPKTTGIYSLGAADKRWASLTVGTIGPGRGAEAYTIDFTSGEIGADEAFEVGNFQNLSASAALSIPKSVPSNPESSLVYLYYNNTGTYAESSSGGGVADVYKLTLKRNNVQIGVFDAGAADATINISVPTKVSDLTNDSSFITIGDVRNELESANPIVGVTASNNGIDFIGYDTSIVESISFSTIITAALPATGSATAPVYLSAAGIFSVCSTYAGGTAVTLNGVDKSASAASFYAPTSVGSSGQVLRSSGNGAPVWESVGAIASGNTGLVTGDAVYQYVGQATTSALKYKGTVGTGGTVTTLPATHNVGDVYVVSTAGTYAGKSCEVGDYIICRVSGTVASDADWDVLNGENQVSDGNNTLAAGAQTTVGTVDGTPLHVNSPTDWDIADSADITAIINSITATA